MNNQTKTKRFSTIGTKIKTKTAEMFWETERILRMNIVEGAELDLARSHDNLNAIDLITRNHSFYMLIDARTPWNSSKEAREYMAKEEAKRNILARAVIVKSLSTRLFAMFTTKFVPQDSTTKIFNSEEKAIGWLKSLSD